MRGFALAAIGGSGISGSATIVDLEGDSSVIIAALAGLAADSQYAGHVHTGSCAAQGGVAHVLSASTGAADGTGSATSTDVPDGLLGDGYYVQYHAPGGAAVACGDLSAAVELPVRTVVLASVGGSGVSGTGTVVDEADASSTVFVSLSGLTAGSQYAGHVHTGSCGVQGTVVHVLGTVTAGDDGTGSAGSTGVPDSVLTTGFYLQYHAPGGAPVACGDITA